jgi:hypothetical protein
VAKTKDDISLNCRIDELNGLRWQKNEATLINTIMYHLEQVCVKINMYQIKQRSIKLVYKHK